MRNFLIAVVLGLTGLTFYSAFAYKSKVIEDDITKRVTDDLTASNAQGVGIDVDGRHVTLSGIVYDEAQETAYLKTANDTYGALGPIDGLTYQADGGYVTAQKTDAGITLRGSVPNEAARASLLESAAAATDGAVDDQLVISGPEADWQGETQFGMQQLAGLSAGALTASAAGYVLSGTTDGDAAAISAPVAEREGWSAFVSSPVVATGLQGQVADLNGQIVALKASEVTVTAERDALDSRLKALKDGLSDELVTGESLRSDLLATRADLDTANVTIAERDQTIAAFNAEKSTLVSRAIDTDGALADTEQKLNGAKATIVALTAASSVKDGTISELTGRVSTLEDELANGQAALGSTDEQVATLRGTVAERDASISALNIELGGQDDTIDVLEAQVAEKDAGLAAADETIAGMEANATKLDAEVYTLGATVAARDTTIANLNDRLTDTSSSLQSDNERIAQLATIVQQREANIDALTSVSAEKDSDIGALNGQVKALRNRVAVKSDENDVIASENGALNGQVNALRNRVAVLSDENDAIASDNGALNGQVNALRNRSASLSSDNGAVTGRIEELTAVVAARDATIASLRSQGGNANVAEQCATQASNVMEGARINFGSGNARITEESNALLERLTGIALACVGEDLTVEIGGHTDSQGSEAANKGLSERRAQAVLAFMAERGVPADGVRAVGYGEGTPIATNNTAAGRAANRRITFEWQAR